METVSQYHCPISRCEYKGWNRKDMQRHLLFVHNKVTHDTNDLKGLYHK